MRKVGSTTDTADANGEYTNGNVANGISPTIINAEGNDSNLLIVFYVQIMPDDLVMQLHRF